MKTEHISDAKFDISEQGAFLELLTFTKWLTLLNPESLPCPPSPEVH